MVGWHHQFRYRFEQALGIGDGKGSLACCSPRGHEKSDTTEHTHSLTESHYCFAPSSVSLRMRMVCIWIYRAWEEAVPC